MIDLFYECKENDIANYSDHTTPYSCGTDIPTVISELQHISTKVFNLFGNNHMKANPGKCHLLISTKSPEVVSVDGIKITSTTAETLLGITIDSELSFENHLSAICNKVSRNINALGRIANYMALEKRRTVMKTFIESQFNYCPLIWMFHSRTINKKTHRLHERALSIVYSDFRSSFEGLPMKDISFLIHERNIQILTIEIYKFLNGLSPSFLNNVFHQNISNSYDLRNREELYSRNPKTVRYGTETISYMAPKIWSKVSETIKMSSSLQSIKTKTCKRKPQCDCPHCKTYLHHVGFVNPLSANPTKWPNTLKQFVGKLPANCLSVFGRFVKLAVNVM